ncbi:MAG: hypothetical protein ACXVCF_16055 [Isosphaeraceae bacterium]
MTSPFQVPEQHDDQDWQQVDQVIADRERQLALPENDKSDDDCLERGMIEKLRRYLSYRHVFP